MSNQSLRQQSVREVTGSESTYEGDWHALFDQYTIPEGPFNGRLLNYINMRLSASYTSLPSAMAGFAIANGVANWNSLGLFTASMIPPVPPVPTPADRVAQDANGLDNYQTTFNTVVPGGIIIGIAGKNNASVPVDITVTVNDLPVELIVMSTAAPLASAFTYIAAVTNIAIGTHTLKVVKNGTSSAGTAAIRIIETDPLPVGWKGETIGFTSAGTATGVAVRLPNTQVGSTVISISAWNDKRAFQPFCETYRVPRVRQQVVRTDLVRDLVTVGFFRSPVEGNDIYLAFKSNLSASNNSCVMAELRGVTLRP